MLSGTIIAPPDILPATTKAVIAFDHPAPLGCRSFLLTIFLYERRVVLVQAHVGKGLGKDDQIFAG